MRKSTLIPWLLALGAGCAADGGPREQCWIPPIEEVELEATTAETLGERLARRAVHEPQPPTHAADLGDCPPPTDDAARRKRELERAIRERLQGEDEQGESTDQER